MNVDCVILTKTVDERFYKMTNDTIESLINSEPSIKFDIKLVESNYSSPFRYNYSNVETIKPIEQFNYNRFLNLGLEKCHNDWIILSNNDVTYTTNWFTNLMSEHDKDPELLSMCPYEPNWHKQYYPIAVDVNYGYSSKTFITGWCIIINKKVVERIGKFDEQFAFWYQDDDYGRTIQKHNIKHAMIKSSVVYHLGSQSHILLSDEQKAELTFNQKKVFDSKWSGN